MRALLATGLACILLSTPPAAHAEDQQLRNQAIALMDGARLASRFQGPLNIVTDVSFTASLNGEAAQSGTYKRTRNANGALRQDIAYPGFQSSFIDSEGGIASTGPWNDKPYAVRKLREFVPYNPLRFDATDVIESITDSSSAGQPARCIAFVTVRGEDRNPGEICVSKSNGTVLEWHDSQHSWTASSYTTVAGAMVPDSFTYREGNSFLLTAQVRFTLLDAPSAEAMAIPAAWNPAEMCSTFQPAVANFAPQPPTHLPQSAVVPVSVHLHVSTEGKVESANVLKAGRPELDAEAVKLALTWHYKPSLCNGTARDSVVDAILSFQGW
jgi:TonB family protein